MPLYSEAWIRRVVIASAVMGAVLMSACSTTPSKRAAPPVAAAPPSYADLMGSADEAQKNGQPGEALALFERAAKADPSKAQPWLRIAQSQFDARNYGTAIIAAQEVQQRDSGNVTAKSILAASGLRVAARALDQMRVANQDVGTTLDEARALARTMREALGEPILQVEDVQEVKPVRLPARRSAVAVPSSPPVTVAPRPATVTARPAPSPAATVPTPTTRRNPFDALKD